jgi:hypothetical protein
VEKNWSPWGQWDWCDFKNIFTEKMAFLTKNKAKLCKKNDRNIGF